MSYALITGGGTTAPVDVIRSMANSAKGSFAIEFAQQFQRRGVPVVLVLSKVANAFNGSRIPKGVEVLLYETYDDYIRTIACLLSRRGQPAYALSAAAVSDFGKLEPVVGKISSGGKLTLELDPLPKVLDSWRPQMGKACTIVGFKLMSAQTSTVAQVLAAARKQNKRARLNMTLANIKEEITGGIHPVWMVTPDGGTVRIDGYADEVARQVVDHIIRIHYTTWHRSVRQGAFEEARVSSGVLEELASPIIELAQRVGLLTDASGNISVCDPGVDETLLVSPRGVDKSKLRARDMVVVQLGDAGDHVVRWWGKQGTKPSIDTSVVLTLKGQLKPFQASLHFHDGWVLGDIPRTRLAYPCGTLEQAAVIREAAASFPRRAYFCPNKRGHSLMIELRDHGHILFVHELRTLVRRLSREWDAVLSAYRQHLADIGREDFMERIRVQPIWLVNEIIGLTAELDGNRSFYLLETARGKGLGEQLIELIYRRGQQVVAHDGCGVADFYRRRGFRTVERIEEEGLTVLEPPTLRQDLIDATTVTFHCTTTDRVLLIQRGEGTTYPEWWANPGGRDDEGDRNPVATAVREGLEEIGVDFTGLPDPDRITVHYTGWVNPKAPQQERGYRVKHLVVPVVIEFEPHPDGSEVTDAQWSSKDEARERKMGPATRATLRKIWSDF